MQDADDQCGGQLSTIRSILRILLFLLVKKKKCPTRSVMEPVKRILLVHKTVDNLNSMEVGLWRVGYHQRQSHGSHMGGFHPESDTH